MKMQSNKMKVKKIKVATLTGALLDYWVVKALGYRLAAWKGGYRVFDSNGDVSGYIGNVAPRPITLFKMSPSTDWSQGGPIIDREEIELVHRNGMDGLTLWAIKGNVIMRGETKLIAAMRAYVASKLGEEVDEI